METPRKKHKKAKTVEKPTLRKKSYAQRIKWGPFETMLAKSGSRPGQCLGVGHRALLVEIVNPQSGSAYIQIPSSFALLTSKSVREINPVSAAYFKYYSELQTTLKKYPGGSTSSTSSTSSSLPALVSIDGEFVVTATDIYTFNKKMALATEKSAIKTFESLKLETGMDVSDSSLEESEVIETEIPPENIDLEEGPVEVVIHFDSDDEMGDYFEETEKTETKKSAKNHEPEDSYGIETLQAGVLYPLIQFKDFFKRSRDGTLPDHLIFLRDQTKKFEDGLLDELKDAISEKLDDLGTRMANKVAKFELERRGIQHKINRTKKTLSDAQKMSGMAISTEVKKYQDIINEAKLDLRELYASLANATETIKDLLRAFLSDLDDIE